VRRRRGRQAAPCGHSSTVGQRHLRLVLRDDQQERRRTSSPAPAGRTPVRTVMAHVTAALSVGSTGGLAVSVPGYRDPRSSVSGWARR
jgi:hypothetical protein